MTEKAKKKEKKEERREGDPTHTMKSGDKVGSPPSPQTGATESAPDEGMARGGTMSGKIKELEQRIKALEEGMAQTLQALQNINKFFEQIQKQKEEATAPNNPIPQTQTQVVPQFDLESLAPLLQFFLGGGKSELDKLKDKVFLRWLTRKTVYENLVDKMFLKFAKKMLSKEEFEELKKVFEEE